MPFVTKLTIFFSSFGLMVVRNLVPVPCDELDVDDDELDEDGGDVRFFGSCCFGFFGSCCFDELDEDELDDDELDDIDAGGDVFDAGFALFFEADFASCCCFNSTNVC